MTVGEGFVARHVASLAAHPGCWIVGRVVLPPDVRATSFGRYRDDLLEMFHLAHLSDRPTPTDGVTAQSLSLPRRDFLALGGFDEDFTIASGEDWELGMRARQRGVRILYDPQIVAVHEDWAVDLLRFCQRQRLYSISDVLLVQKYGQASPRWPLVQANGPCRLGQEPFIVFAKKLAKATLSNRAGRRALAAATGVAGRAAPDGAITRKSYDMAVAVAIFEGVREGVRRYGDPAAGVDEPERRTVCHLIDASSSTAYFEAIARHADPAAHPVLVGSIAPAGALQPAMAAAGAGTFSLGATRRAGYPLALLRLVRLLRSQHVAVVHAHCFDPTVLGLLAARIARCRFVFTRHHSDHNIRMGKQWHTRVDGWCARRADHVVAVSEATRRVLTDHEGVDSGRITVVHNGMDPIEPPPPEAAAACRAALGLAADARLCLVVGRLHEEKGHRVLFDAIPTVVAAVGAVQWAIVGDGPDRADLEQEVARRHLPGVHFLGRRTDVPVLIGASTVVVQPSLAESFGFAALEGSALGRPVVASDAGGLPEVVVDGVTGLIVPRGDPVALAQALCRLLKDPGLAEGLGRAGMAYSSRFRADRMVREYERVYSGLGLG